MKISINEPCHENWEAMTPNQKGAFCGSCQKDVVDFSKMSLQGIKNFFSKSHGKVCGRFEEKQLQELSFDDFFAKFTYWNFSKKFAVIFFMAFGFWIFSNQAMAQRSEHLKGDVAYEPQPKVVQKETPKAFVQGQPVIMGKPAVQHEPKKPGTKKIMGKIKCTQPRPKEKEPVKVKDSTVVEPVNKVEPKDMVVGLIAYIPEDRKLPVVHDEIKKPLEIYKQPVKVAEIRKNAPAEETKTSKESKMLIFPNPSNGSFMVETKEKQTLNIFDGTGKIVHTQTVSGNTQVNAGYLVDGIYTLSLTGTGNPVFKKIIIAR